MVIAKGQQMLADDILRLNFLPVGTILLYDGTNWIDDRTIPGWVQCDGITKTVKKPDNSGTVSIVPPNLKDKFIKGKGTKSNEGGSNALTSAMLPKHTHEFSTSEDSHTHTFTGTTATGNVQVSHGGYEAIGSASGVFSASNPVDYAATGLGGYRGYSTFSFGMTPSGTNSEITHNHSGTTSDNSGISDTTNDSNMPSYYSVIYIRKCI